MGIFVIKIKNTSYYKIDILENNQNKRKAD